MKEEITVTVSGKSKTGKSTLILLLSNFLLNEGISTIVPSECFESYEQKINNTKDILKNIFVKFEEKQQPRKSFYRVIYKSVWGQPIDYSVEAGSIEEAIEKVKKAFGESTEVLRVEKF